MTPRRPRDIGTAAESATVRYLQANGFENAERRALRGALDAGDVTGCPGLAISVKGGAMAKTASDRLITAWLAELERQRVNAAATVGVLVQQRPGVGPPNAGRWWAWLPWGSLCCGLVDGPPVRMHLADAVTLLRAAGYGDPA